MGKYVTSSNVQEMAAAFANTVAAAINAAAAKAAGVDVMWFRATPDKRNQDVIFQTYTLWGVSDCPLEFKAVYTDTSYDDAAITYNIMGLEYAVPLCLEIALNTWNEATKFDGTLPQKGDIVFIPISNKLMEVVSMTPVKAIGAQITSFKVNCSAYKPSRARIVGEDLNKSISDNTTSLRKAFGTEIDMTMANIVDDKELSLFSSTERDGTKELPSAKHSVITNVQAPNTVDGDLVVDGHTVARGWYDMDVDDAVAVKYLGLSDTVSADSKRCLSCWASIGEWADYRNVRGISVGDTSLGATELGLSVTTGSFAAGERVVLERGGVCLYGTVTSAKPLKVAVNASLEKAIAKALPDWNLTPGFVISRDGGVNLLHASSSDGALDVSVRGGRFVVVTLGGKETAFQLPERLPSGTWHGFVVNFGSTLSLDVYRASPKLARVQSLSAPTKLWTARTFEGFSLLRSKSLVTNVRLYACANTDIDRQITDLVTYNIPDDSMALINDSANLYITLPYYGEQR